MNCCPSNLLSGSTPHPPSLCQSILYTDSVWLAGGGGVVESCWRPYYAGVRLTPCIWPNSEPTKLPYHPKKPRREGGLRQINTCRKVLYRPIFKWRQLALVSIWLISPWLEGIRTGIVWNIARFTSCAWRWKKKKSRPRYLISNATLEELSICTVCTTTPLLQWTMYNIVHICFKF